MFRGPSRSVSLVPGAPPRCETPPTAPSPSTSTTVHPIGRSISVSWPTRRPVTVVRPACAALEDGGGFCAPISAVAASAMTGADSVVAKARGMAVLAGWVPALLDRLERPGQPTRHRGRDVHADV